jgi:thermitase
MWGLHQKKEKQMRRSIVLLTMVAAVVLALGAAALAQRSEPGSSQAASAQSAQDFVPGEVLVKFEPGASGQDIADIHRRVGGQVKEVIRGIDVRVVGVARGQEKTAVARYQQNPNVRYAELNGVDEAAATGPNDPSVGKQWAFNNTGQTVGTTVGTTDADIDAFETWNYGSTPAVKAGTRGSAAFPIAVLDTGIQTRHEDLSGQVTKSENVTSSGGIGNGHGTHVAGIVAAITDNGKGVAGTCPRCVVYNVKVIGANNKAAFSDEAEGIKWAADNGAKVINMSFGGTTVSKTVAGAVNYAWGKGVVLVAAAMNDGETNKANYPHYPAAYQNVIAVGSTDSKDQKASTSDYGHWVDVAAPGKNIYSTVFDNPKTKAIENDLYGPKSGTSMASPYVAGIAGLVWSKPGLCTTNACVRTQIESSVVDRTVLRGIGPDWSKARVNACIAVTSCKKPPGGVKPPVASGSN